MGTIVPRFDFRVDCAVSEDLGATRKRHEDASLVAPEAGLFIVADGMGGHAAGDIASRMAVEEVREALTSDVSFHILERYVASPDLSARRNVFARIRRAVERANQALLDNARENEERLGMGSTIDVLWLVRNHAFVGHAGDGRVYLARRRAVLQLTQDHGQLEALKASGAVRPAGKAQRNALLNAVGLKETVTVDTLFVDLHKGDRLLLCTDGVHGQVSSESRLAELVRAGSAKDAARSLVKEAGRKGLDNATALVVEIGERFVRRPSAEQGLLSKDIERASQCALLHGLGPSLALAALSAGVEIEYAAERTIPRVVANDMVAYIVLEGTIDLEDGLTMGEGAVLFPESLAGVWDGSPLPVARERVRLLRLRADDFDEVCSDPSIGATLYRRLATMLARNAVRSRKRTPTPPATVKPRPADEEPEPSDRTAEE